MLICISYMMIVISFDSYYRLDMLGVSEVVEGLQFELYTPHFKRHDFYFLSEQQ